MKQNQLSYETNNNLENLPLEMLRARWSEVWGCDPHSRIGRTMLIKSLEYKSCEQALGGLNREHQQRLDQLIKSYTGFTLLYGLEKVSNMRSEKIFHSRSLKLQKS